MVESNKKNMEKKRDCGKMTKVKTVITAGEQKQIVDGNMK